MPVNNENSEKSSRATLKASMVMVAVRGVCVCVGGWVGGWVVGGRCDVISNITEGG